MIIDSHQHVIISTEKQLGLMKEAGVEKTILFGTTVHPELALDLKAFEMEMGLLNEIVCGKQNAKAARIKAIEEQVNVINENPQKFIGFGSVPIGVSQEETSRWIEHKVIANKFRGLGEITLAPGQVNMLKPIFLAARDFGRLPIWIHTFSPLTLADIKAISKLAGEFLEVPVIFGHLGGANWLETIKLAKENKNIFLDLSATFSNLVVSLAIKTLPERTLFSSDAPYGNPLLCRQAIEIATSDKSIRKRVLGENIAKLLNL